MNLVRAEFSRLAARGFVRLMVVLLIGCFGITAATTLAVSVPPSAAELARAEHAAALRRAHELRAYQECLLGQLPGRPPESRTKVPERCFPTDLSEIRAEDYIADAFVFSREIQSLMYFLTAFLALFGFLLGASFIGAELTSGGMTNLLLWESRRPRVLGTKLGIVLAGVTVVSTVATVLYVAVFRLIATVAGLPGRVDGELWSSIAVAGGRGLVTAMVATAAGFGIATLGRHTAAALGVVAAYVVVWEVGARAVLTILDGTAPERWLLSTYLGAWILGDVRVSDGNCLAEGGTSCTVLVTGVHAAVVFGLLLAALLTGAFRTFARRDLA